MIVRVTVLLLSLASIGLPLAGRAQAPNRQDSIEIFDAHLHYNWEPKPFYTRDEVLALFKKNRVTGILATSRPNDGTYDLVAAKTDGLHVVPFIRPYKIRADIGSWFNDPGIYDLVVSEHAKGGYRGIGEFHLSVANARSEWVQKTLAFAAANNLMLHAHADDATIEILFEHQPKARIIWAHTGFSLASERVRAMLDKYPSLWGEMSYRGGITDGAGQLTPEWRQLFTDHPTRFLLGSDTWINERWASYGEIMSSYRAWLAQLPPDIATKIAHSNARDLFRN